MSLWACLKTSRESLVNQQFALPFTRPGKTPEQDLCKGAVMIEQRVTVEITDGVADVRLARPEKRNALDGAMFAGLVTAGERLKSEPGVRAVVLSGEGPDFCAGLDFASFAAMRDGEWLSLQVDLPPGHGPAQAPGQRAAYVWTEIPVPVIAAMTGNALGGGLQIALGADIRIVAPDTRMSACIQGLVTGCPITFCDDIS